jgi:hypothetical protein
MQPALVLLFCCDRVMNMLGKFWNNTFEQPAPVLLSITNIPISLS